MWFRRRSKTGFAAEKKIATVDYYDVPFTKREDIHEGDIVIHMLIYVNANGAYPATAACTEIVFRPSTKELFRLECWNKKHRSYVNPSADYIEDNEQPARC